MEIKEALDKKKDKHIEHSTEQQSYIMWRIYLQNTVILKYSKIIFQNICQWDY
jgi:hypothetical protein